MFRLLKKARVVLISLFIIYITGWAVGYISGKLHYVEYNTLQNEGIFKFSRTLEYKIPGYNNALNSYKAYHHKLQVTLISKKDFWGIGLLIFFNNFIVANLTMIIRALFVVPIILNIFGKFFLGVVFAQTPTTPLLYCAFIMEFGGYFLTICATLSGVFWIIFNRRFGFPSRKEAIVNGLKLLGYMYLISGIGMFFGSLLETLFLKNMLG
jgi:hypothetical protein